MDLVTRVRLATLDDLNELTARDRLPEPELAAILDRGRILLAVSDDGASLIGWLRWGLFWDEVPFMNHLYVDAPLRGAGVGRLLVSEWERACGRDGHDTVMTSTLSAETAQHFYRRLGYTDAGCLLLPGESAEIFFIKCITPDSAEPGPGAP
jgi:GNAT superfamily N-acetyltransferase